MLGEMRDAEGGEKEAVQEMEKEILSVTRG